MQSARHSNENDVSFLLRRVTLGSFLFSFSPSLSLFRRINTRGFLRLIWTYLYYDLKWSKYRCKKQRCLVIKVSWSRTNRRKSEVPAGGKTRKWRKQNGHNREIKRTVRRGALYYKILGWYIGDTRRNYETAAKNRGDKRKKRSISNLEWHASDLSPEILVTDRRAVFPVFSPELIRHSEAVSELASDYSGCSSLIVSATSLANREESFSSGTVALDHELTKTFVEEGVYRRTRRVAASCGYSFKRNGVH